MAVRCIPSGLDEVSHFFEGLSVQSSLDAEPPLAQDMAFAVDMVAACGSGIDAWRQKQWTSMEGLLGALSDWNKNLD